MSIPVIPKIHPKTSRLLRNPRTQWRVSLRRSSTTRRVSSLARPGYESKFGTTTITTFKHTDFWKKKRTGIVDYLREGFKCRYRIYKDLVIWVGGTALNRQDAWLQEMEGSPRKDLARSVCWWFQDMAESNPLLVGGFNHLESGW